MARAAAFSLLELVLVIVILGVVAGIAIPRLSLAGKNAAAAALAGDLATLQSAIDQYEAEHLGNLPDPGDITDQLVFYSDEAGQVAPNPGPLHIFGPYLRKVPVLPLGPNAGAKRIDTKAADDVGWIYVPDSGRIYPNLFDDGGQLAPDMLPLLGLTGPPLTQFKKTGILP